MGMLDVPHVTNQFSYVRFRKRAQRYDRGLRFSAPGPVQSGRGGATLDLGRRIGRHDHYGSLSPPPTQKVQ